MAEIDIERLASAKNARYTIPFTADAARAGFDAGVASQTRHIRAAPIRFFTISL